MKKNGRTQGPAEVVTLEGGTDRIGPGIVREVDTICI